jgi:hypothetical protein
MGKDKFENEDLIKWAWPEDVWFHADKFSSAHVYLRLAPPILTIDQIPEALVEELCQLTKENSIEGRKRKAIKVQYTMASNLLKSPEMEVGAVSFKDSKLVNSRLTEKNREIINKIAKTKQERSVDLSAERSRRDALERRRTADEKRRLAQEEKSAIESSRNSSAQGLGGYDSIFAELQEISSANKPSEDDFM